MKKTCQVCSQGFECTDADLSAIEKASPTIAGTTHSLPPPTLCPPCRQQRRFTFRNDRHYYRNTCNLCKKSTVSIYSPDKGLPILCEECFWKDKWDPLDHGQEIDFSKSFFDQYAKMREPVPRLAIFHTQSENSDYTVHSSRNRNCYMSSSLINCEDVCYSDQTFDSKDCIDCVSCINMELCYECAYCDQCFGSAYLDHCTNVSDSYLCFDCRGCQNVIGCVGLRNKNNMILNEEATKSDCEEIKRKLNTDPAFRSSFQKKYHELSLEYPRRDRWVVQAENCTGTELFQCKNVAYGFDAKEVEDGRYVYMCVHSKDLYDCTKVLGEMCYESAGAVDLRFACFTNLCYQSDNMLYCDNCQNSKDCFGCMSLKKHQYCILNTQYNEEEYASLTKKLIAHMQSTHEWGEYFPQHLSAFSYNESKANMWYPLSQEEAEQRGWNWSPYEHPMPDVTKTIPAEKLPSNIEDVPDDILNWAIICEETRKLFKITKQELDFYRRMGIPIPHRTELQRYKDRTRGYRFWEIYDRTCSNCNKDIQTTYSPERKELVYCEDCYLKEVY